MSDDNLQRTIGGLETSVKELANQQGLARKEQREDMRRIYERLETISSSGCAVGKKNMEAISELQKRPERLVGIGAAIVAILSALGSAFLWMQGRMGE